jgi:hypothetical protein
MTEHEREEDRLWNGKEYVSMPENMRPTQQIGGHLAQHPDACVDNLAQFQSQSAPGFPAEVPGLYKQADLYHLISTNIHLMR